MHAALPKDEDAAKVRFGRQSWLDLGLAVLAADGAEALTIERLCAKAGRTKGSFYHHFPAGGDAFADALLAHWRQAHTERLIDRIEHLPGPRDRRAELDRLAAGLDGGLERAVRRWAGGDERARAALREVDRRRVAYLARVIRDVLRCDEREAEDLARIEYAAFVGLQQVFPEVQGAELEGLFRKLTDLVTPPPDQRRALRPAPTNGGGDHAP